MKRLDRYAGKIYLSAICATNYPEQAPEHAFAKWYDLLWLLIPMVGYVLFVETIEARGKRHDAR